MESLSYNCTWSSGSSSSSAPLFPDLCLLLELARAAPQTRPEGSWRLFTLKCRDLGVLGIYFPQGTANHL